MSEDTYELLVALRGSTPEVCDWCKNPFWEYDPIPEEGGQWICYNCYLAEEEYWRSLYESQNQQGDGEEFSVGD